MKRTSLAHAKAHLSELVDDAEHRGKRTMILRHGKPAAVLVPVAVAIPTKPKGILTREEIDAIFEALWASGDPTVSAVDDLVRGRR